MSVKKLPTQRSKALHFTSESTTYFARKRIIRSTTPRYGGLIQSLAGIRDWRNTGNCLLKVSKPARPWIAPMPLGPMPPNGSVVHAEMHQRVVDGDAARARARQDAFDVRAVAVERIQRQRPRMRVDVGDRFVELP